MRVLPNLRLMSGMLGVAMCLLATLPDGKADTQDAASHSVNRSSIGSVTSGESLNFAHTTVTGHLTAGQDILCRFCEASGNFRAGRDVVLEGCQQVNGVVAGHDVTLQGSRALAAITAGRMIRLEDSTAESDLTAGNDITIGQAVVGGAIKLGGHTLRMDHSEAGRVRFTGQSSPMSGGVFTSAQGGSVILHNSMMVGSSFSGGGMGTSRVAVGPGSLSRVNGYTIQGASEQTTLITPEQTIYVNGRRTSGAGPLRFADYRAAHPQAPEIQGPGWPTNEIASSSFSASNKPSSLSRQRLSAGKHKWQPNNEPVVHTVYLSHGSIIHGPIEFEGGYGEVRADSTSRVEGPIRNGRLVRVSQGG